MTSTLDRDRSRSADDSASPLHDLAAHIGIVTEYFDMEGRIQTATDPARRAILSALGYDTSTDETTRDALERLLREEREELVAPVRVVRRSSSTPTALAVHVPSAARLGASWRLELAVEGAQRRVTEGTFTDASVLALALPGDLPLGYHQVCLTLTSSTDTWSNEQTLIIVPDRCSSPAELLGESDAFGLIANLYTVRSNTNWGVGDLSDLARLAEWGGGVGAEFVGVNPLHALLNRGVDVSPYSPVSLLAGSAIRSRPSRRTAP